MLSTDQLHKIFNNLKTPQKGRRLIEKARKNAPVRKVESKSKNVITYYNSAKMERIIATESKSVEYPAQIGYEYDDSAIEYYAQPCQVDIFRTDGGMIKKSRFQHFPDFLVIREDQLVFEEWKTEKKLQWLAKKYPNRYFHDIDGWHDPEIEEYFLEAGLTYRLRSESEIPQQYITNLEFLSDYICSNYPPVDPNKLLSISNTISEKTYLSISELYTLTNEDIKDKYSENHAEYIDQQLITYDDIYKAIADKHIYFDLHQGEISYTYSAIVYRDEITMKLEQKLNFEQNYNTNLFSHASLKTGAQLEYDGKVFDIVLVGEEKLTITDINEQLTELKIDFVIENFKQDKIKIINKITDEDIKKDVQSLSPRRIKIGLKILNELELAERNPDLFPKSKRTLQRYRKAVAGAGDSVIDKISALTKETDERGKKRKLTDKHLNEIFKIVNKEYNDPANVKKKAVYKLYLEKIMSKGWIKCSPKTFNKELNKLISVRERKGKRFDYQQQKIVWYLHHDEIIHGVRPFHFVHIDHTQVDLSLKGFMRKIILGKAWLSIGMDTATRKIIGFYLSFDSPSYRSNMMVLRDIVRRHGRMPYLIVVDNGKDFHSNEFQRVCRLYNCHIRYRPAGQPRVGSVIERAFGTTNTTFVHNLKGNTKLMKHVRMVTKSVRPENFSEWTLPALHGGLEYFFEEVYGDENHPALGESVNENFPRRMIETGERKNRLVKFNRTFLIETCPSPKGQTKRTIDWQRGIKVNHIWYSANEFRDNFMSGIRIEVRVDPWDASVVYALVNNEWIECRSKLVAYRGLFTRKELQYGIEEIASKFRVKKKEFTPAQVAKWIKLLNPRNFDPQLLERQSEARSVYGPLDMASVDRSYTNINEPVDISETPKIDTSVLNKAENQSESPINKPSERKAYGYL